MFSIKGRVKLGRAFGALERSSPGGMGGETHERRGQAWIGHGGAVPDGVVLWAET